MIRENIIKQVKEDYIENSGVVMSEYLRSYDLFLTNDEIKHLLEWYGEDEYVKTDDICCSKNIMTTNRDYIHDKNDEFLNRGLAIIKRYLPKIDDLTANSLMLTLCNLKLKMDSIFAMDILDDVIAIVKEEE